MPDHDDEASSDPTPLIWTREKFNAALDHIRQFHRPTRCDEPPFYFLENPDFNDWAREYTKRASPPGSLQYYEMAEPNKNTGKLLTELFAQSLESYGDPRARTREDMMSKAYRMADYYKRSPVELLVIAGIHNLRTPKAGRPQPGAFKTLLCALKNTIRPRNILFIGEYKTSAALICQDAWTCGRVQPLSYPRVTDEERARAEWVMRSVKSEQVTQPA
jgi:hypothetical protein